MTVHVYCGEKHSYCSVHVHFFSPKILLKYYYYIILQCILFYIILYYFIIAIITHYEMNYYSKLNPIHLKKTLIIFPKSTCYPDSFFISKQHLSCVEMSPQDLLAHKFSWSNHNPIISLQATRIWRRTRRRTRMKTKTKTTTTTTTNQINNSGI